MDPSNSLPSDRDSATSVSVQQLSANVSNQIQQPTSQPSPSSPALVIPTISCTSIASGTSPQQPPQHQPSIDRLSRPMAFDKMEIIVREMQDPDCGVPVRSQKLFLTSIPSAFMGYDLIEWLMERLSIEESEALNIANQLCLHGYFFPVSDSKTLVVKDDSSLYRFQTAYYWPWQHKPPDNVEYAIYLVKRSLRNRQRHGLEEYEVDALASLHKNLKAKWEVITMQAEEQVRLSKLLKKGEKIVADSQERAYWRVHRPPPGQFTPLEPCPVPSRDRQGKPRRRTVEDCQREVDYLKASMGRTRIKMSQACEFLVQHWETYADYDFFLQSALPSNPWVTEDLTFWQLNQAIVDLPTEKRVKRWSISIEELVSDPTGLQEFTIYLKKEYSHENIRFWTAVNDLRRSAHSQITRKVKEIYEEFLEPGAPCEINIDSKTMERVQGGLKSPSRFTFDAAAEHIYTLLLKKDCYPRFVRSEHYKSLLATGIQPSHKKRFFGFGGATKKKSTTAAPPNMALLSQTTSSGISNTAGNLARRRGSDRSLTGSAHELAICGVKDVTNKVPHSHSQSNLSEITYSVVIYRGDMPSGGGNSLTTTTMSDVPNVKASTATGVRDASKNINPEGSKSMIENMESALTAGASAICPWDQETTTNVSVSVCPWDEEEAPSTSKQSARSRNNSTFDSGSSSSDVSEISDRMRRSCGLRQNTLDCELSGGKRLLPAVAEPRRASISIAPRLCDTQFSFRRPSGQNMTNIELQPSDLSKKNGGIHHVFASSTTTATATVTTAASAPVAATSAATTSTTSTANIAQEPPYTPLPPKSSSFDDRDSFRVTSPRASSEEPVSCSRNECELNENTVSNSGNIQDTKDTENNESVAHKNVNQSGSSVFSENVSATSTDTCVPSISMSATPTINVVCAPVVEENNDKCVVVRKLSEFDASGANDSENKTDTRGDDDAAHDAFEGQLAASAESVPLDSLSKQLSLDVQKSAEHSISAEDLSPSMDEYQECCPASEYHYDSATAAGLLAPGCVAPAPTPAPLIAPLAEIETYPVDDEPATTAAPEDEAAAAKQPQKHRKRLSGDSKGEPSSATTKSTEEMHRNDVCPWEDEDGASSSEGKFVKTYATLGYL